jgi:hypothetical protein
MKKIGFLSFGHWTPSSQSQTRSAADALLQSIELAVAAEDLGADGADFRVQRPRQHVHLWAGRLTVTPGRRGSRQKISKTTPCKVAGDRRNRRFEPILDTSGKSAALLHHRKIRWNDRGRAAAAVRCDARRSALAYDRTSLQVRLICDLYSII